MQVPSLDIIGEMSSSFNYGQTLRIARDTAGALGDVAAQAKYAAAFAAVQAAFHKVYYSPAKKTYRCFESHHLGPTLAHFSAPPRPARALCRALRCAHADRVLIGC